MSRRVWIYRRSFFMGKPIILISLIKNMQFVNIQSHTDQNNQIRRIVIYILFCSYTFSMQKGKQFTFTVFDNYTVMV